MELDRMTDAYTDELFGIEDEDMRLVEATVSRLVVDMERFTDDRLEPMAKRGMGVLYTHTHDCRPLRKSIGSKQRQLLLETYYRPHHGALNAWARESLREHGEGLLIDAHSFPDAPRYYGYENHELPDFCIGSDSFHTPPDMAELLIAFIRDSGFTVAENTPFAGSLTPSEVFGRDRRIQSVMIEVNRRLYLAPNSLARGERFDEIQSFCKNLVSLLAAGQR